jgi:hypothetical protein
MKETLAIIKFFIISVPVFCIVYLIVLSLCKIKDLCGKK